MTTIFDLLNTLNNNNGTLKRQQCPIFKQPATTTKTQSNTNNNNNKQKEISIIPEMDVTMYDDKLVVDVELVGVSKDNIEIDIKDSILTIQGEKKKKTIVATLTTTATTTTASLKKATSAKNDNEPSIEEFEDEFNGEKTNLNNTTSSSTFNSSNTSDTTTTTKKYISERSFGYFKRYLDLTKVLYQLDLNSIFTKFENGLLTITINKKSDYSNIIKISIN